MGTRPFSRNEDEVFHTDMGWLSRQGLSSLGFAYREAGEALCEAPRLSGRSDEAMYLVASFAFRQSIENYLKAIVTLVECHTRQKYPKPKATHGLLSLWDWIDAKLVAMGEERLPKDTRSVVADFEHVDPNGTAFRYNRDLKGNEQLAKLPQAVSLTNLEEAATDVINILDALDEFLSDAG